MADVPERALGLGALPAGMRNNNPANIKYLPTLPYAGIVGPSENTDQGDPQAVFETPAAGMAAAYQLALKKYGAGKTSANALIAGNGGWTPGNMQAAANVARAAGLDPDDDLNLTDPASAAKFMRGLLQQEQGSASGAYSDDLINSAITGGSGRAALSGGVKAQPATGRLSGLSQNAIIGELLKRGAITPEQAAAKGYGGAAPAAADTSPTWLGEAGRGLMSAIGQAPTDILYGAAAPVGAAGMSQAASAIEGLAEKLRPASTTPGPTVPSLSDINSVGDVGRYAFGALGNAVGSTVPTLVGGAAGAGVGALLGGGIGAVPGGLVGAAGTSYLQQGGQLSEDLREQGIDPKTAQQYATVFAAPMAALDVIGLGKVLKIPAREVEREVARSLAKRIGSGVLEGAGAEGVTETLQQSLQEAAGVLSGGNRSMADRAKNILESGVQGALGGGVLGSFGGVHEKSAEAPEAEVAAEPAAQPDTLALPPPDYKDPVIRPLIDEHNSLRQRGAEMQARLDADPNDINAAQALQFVNQRADALSGQISNLRAAALTPSVAPIPGPEPLAAPVPIPRAAAPQLALPAPDFKDPIIGPVAQQLAAVNDRLGEMQRRAAADPTDANAARAAQFLGARSTELQTQIQNLQQSTVTPAPVTPEPNRALPTPDWHQPQPGETPMAVYDGETDTGHRVFVRQDGQFRHPGSPPNVGHETPLSQLPDRVPSPQEILDAAKPPSAPAAAPVENPKFVTMDEAAQREAQAAAAAQQIAQERQRQQAEGYARYLAQNPAARSEGIEGYLQRAQELPPDLQPATKTFNDIPFRRAGEDAAGEAPTEQGVALARSPVNAAARAEAEKRLSVISKQMFGPQVKIRAADTITAPGEGSSQTSALGMYSAPEGSAQGLIHVAMQAHGRALTDPEQARTVYHEGIHHLKEIGAFKPAEWKVLSDRAQKEWIERYGINDLYPDASPELKTEEAIAEAFSDWRGGEKFGGATDGIFQKIARFFERVANSVRGLGFQSARDIFRQVEKGGIASRPNGNAARSTSPGDSSGNRQAASRRAGDEGSQRDLEGPVSKALRSTGASGVDAGAETPSVKFSLRKLPPPEERSAAGIENGEKAISEILKEKSGTKYNAMFRPEFGWIDFPWKAPGDLGILHTIKRRMNSSRGKQGMEIGDAVSFVRKIPGIIQDGKPGEHFYKVVDAGGTTRVRRNIIGDDGLVVLQRQEGADGRVSWLVTGFPDGSRESPINGTVISAAEADKIVAGASSQGSKVLRADVPGAGRVGPGATRDALRPDRSSNVDAGGQRSKLPSSGTAGAATGEDVSPTTQEVKPLPLGSKFRRSKAAAQAGSNLGAQIKSSAQAKQNAAASTAAGRPATMKAALDQAETNAYGKLSDAVAKTISTIKPGVTSSAIGRAVDNFRTAVQDNFTPVRRAQEAVAKKRGSGVSENEDVYLQQEFYSGRVTDRSERLQREHVAPMLEAMAKAKLTNGDISQYLYARHAPERNARISAINPKFKPGEGSGMTDVEAAKVMSDIKRSGRLADYERVAAMADKMRSQTLGGLVSDGLLEPSQATQWQKLYPNYVPLKGFEGENEMADVMPHTSGGFQVRGAESKAATGRASKASDVLENLVMQAQEGIIRGEKNRVFTALNDLVTNNPDPEYWRVNPVQSQPVFNKKTGLIEYRNAAQQEDAKTVWGKVDGKPVRIRLEDPKLLTSIKNLDAERMGAVVKAIAGTTRFMSALNTQWSPEFVISNAIRDAIQSGVVGQKYDIPKFASSMRKSYFKALKGAYGGLTGAEKTEYEKLFQQYSRLGGRVGFAKTDSLNEIRAKMARELKSHGTGPWQMTKKRAGAIANYIGRTNGAVDNAVRLAAFKAALDGGATPARAAQIGKNITVNFNRKGNMGALANAFYMFFNAGVQGSQVMFSALRSRKVQKIVGAVVAAGAAQELANRMFTGKDDDGQDLYDKIGGNDASSDYIKSNNAVFMIPGAGKDDWNYIKIPLPYGLNVFWGLGRNIAAAAMGKQSIGHTAGNVVGDFANAFNPVGGSGSVLNMLVPSLIDPLVDYYSNADFTGAPIRPESTDKTLPQSAKGQYFASASPASIFIARSLNEISGGNAFKPGVVNANPNDLDHAFGSYAGAAGGLASRLWASTSRAIGMGADPTRPAMTLSEVPFARRVAGTTSPGYDQSMFYERNDQLQIIKNQLEGFQQAGDRASAQQVRQDNKALIPLIGMAEQTQKALAALRKAKSAVLENGTMGTETKKARLTQIEQQQQQLLLRFGTRWNSAMRMQDAA